MIPNQVIPQEEKTEKWAENTARSILQLGAYQTEIHEKVRFCFNFYNGHVNQSDFDYLRKSGDFEYPAMVRHIPLMKTMFKNLKSQEIKRPFLWRSYTVDHASINKKKDAYKNAVLDYLRQNAMERITTVQAAREQISSIEQQIAQAQQEGQQVSPAIMTELNKQKQILEKKDIIDQDEVRKLEKYYKTEYKDILEGISEKGLKYLLRTQNAPMKFNQGFEDVIVTDDQFYFIDCDEHMKDPKLENVDPAHFYYSADDVDWIHECQWAMYEKLMSIQAIADRWPGIGTDKLKDIAGRSFSPINYGPVNFHNYSGYYTTTDGSNYNSDSAMRGQNVKVSFIYWMSPRIIFFYKVYDEEGKWIENVTDKKSAIPEGAEYESRYLNELWESAIADNDIVLYSRRCKHQLYTSDWKHVGLPFTGPNRWGRRRRNSMVWETKDLQIMYNLVHYHKELWLALSGVKGFIMDKSQIPDDMTPEEWMYERKLGVAWIETVKKNKKMPATFNQFQHYDDTISEAVQHLLKMLEHYERLASYVTGVSQQALGMIASTDQVGTTDASIKQTQLTTEIMFQEHENAKRMVLKHWINHARVCWKKGRQDQFIDDDLSQVIFSVPGEDFSRSDYDIHVIDGGKEQQNRSALMQLAMQGRAQNFFDIPATAKMITLENVKELEACLEYYSDLAMKRASDSQQAQIMSEKEQKDMDAQIKMMIENQKSKTDFAKIEVEKARLDFDIRKLEIELDFEQKKLDTEVESKKYQVDSERKVEMLYLDFEKKKAVYDAQINQLQIQLDTVNSNLDKISKAKQKEKVKDQ